MIPSSRVVSVRVIFTLWSEWSDLWRGPHCPLDLFTFFISFYNYYFLLQSEIRVWCFSESWCLLQWWRQSNKSLMTLCTAHPLAINYPHWPELCATSAACQACRVCQQKLRGPLHTRWSGWNDLVTVMVPWFILSLHSPPSPSVILLPHHFRQDTTSRWLVISM